MHRQAVIVLGLVMWFSPVAHAGLVGTDTRGFIYDIDASTGIASNARETDVSLPVVVFGDGTLYGVKGDKLYTVDVATWEQRLLGQLQNLGSGKAIRTLTWDSQTGMLFGITQTVGTTLSQLEAIDLDTLSVTTIGSVFGARALAFDDEGTLYGHGFGNESFFTLDKTNAQILSSITLSPSNLGLSGMVFDGDGTLFVTATEDSVLYALDPLDGSLEAIGSTGVIDGIVSLAYVPEPGTLLLLGPGVLVLLRRRRRNALGYNSLRTG